MTFIFLLLLSLSHSQATTKGQIIETIKQYQNKNDDIALRVAIKKLAAAKPNYNEWIWARRIIHKKPSIGYDLLFKWEQVDFTDNRPLQRQQLETKINGWLRVTDEEMLKGRFQSAFGYYQFIAKTLKKEIMTGDRSNYLLYYITVHSMARALYGAGRYQEALNVYGWIPKDYPRFRQILFEKMWAAFRAKRSDIALGAIASQRSTYFANFMEPESYLVQLYIYKKLCRTEEQKMVRDSVTKFKNKLASGSYNYKDWAKSDIENYSLLRLAEAEIIEDQSGIVTNEEKIKEQSDIRKALITRFESEKNRLLKELNQVVAYSYLAVGAGKLKLTQSDLSRTQLRKSGNEFWPVDDAEDWVDEIGGHLFIGDSLCAEKN